MRVLVTGCAGFIGFHVSQALLERGDEVIGLDNFNPYYDATLKERRNEMLQTYDGFSLTRGDLCDVPTLTAVVEALGEGEDTRVCHLAAQAGVRHSIQHPAEFVRDNIVGFNDLIELCRQRSVGGLIYASSSSVYGNNQDELLRESSDSDDQVSLYGMTKKANELQAAVYHNLYDLPSTGLRFFTVYGPWGRPDMALFLFTDAILRGHPVRVFGHGKMQRDFTYVDDIVAGVVAALDRNHEYEIINLGAGKTEELMDFIAEIERCCEQEGDKQFLPMQPGDVYRTSADIERARELLGYAPSTTIASGIPSFVAWYREYYGM